MLCTVYCTHTSLLCVYHNSRRSLTKDLLLSAGKAVLHRWAITVIFKCCCSFIYIFALWHNFFFKKYMSLKFIVLAISCWFKQCGPNVGALSPTGW